MLTYLNVDSVSHPLTPAARALFQEYADELGVDLCFQCFDDELTTLPGKYGPPAGRLVVVLDEGAPVACGALRPLDDATCELKRIYVKPAYRGRGLGREITARLMDDARDIGYSIVRLDTLRRLLPALKMYEALGFAEIPPYNFNPEPDIVYLERGL